MTNFCTTITRYYGTNDKDLERLDRFITQAKIYSKRILIGINIDKDLTHSIDKYASQSHGNTSIEFIPIQPWIGISTPLNILLNHVSSDEKFVLIQSIEIQCTLDHIDYLRTLINDGNVLCVGVALDGHQKFDESKQDRYILPLEGNTSPWNTFALWNLSKLRRTGFPLCSDFVQPPGMEDSAVIGLQQKLFNGMKHNRALLVHFHSNVCWLTNFNHNQDRMYQHELKMQSKNVRTKQLADILAFSNDNQIGIEYVKADL